MEEPKSFDSIFKQKMFRIPDYQRRYAWQKEQFNDFSDTFQAESGRAFKASPPTEST